MLACTMDTLETPTKPAPLLVSDAPGTVSMRLAKVLPRAKNMFEMIMGCRAPLSLILLLATPSRAADIPSYKRIQFMRCMSMAEGSRHHPNRYCRTSLSGLQ
jgi:hypothetical protein